MTRKTMPNNSMQRTVLRAAADAPSVMRPVEVER